MAEFLTRHGIVHHMDRIIKEADKELILISAYIQLDDRTKDRLQNKKRGTKVHVIYRKGDLKKRERDFLDEHDFRHSSIENLHAKCYLNENQALITSMNLYQYSQEKNEEMGILVSREDDRELYEEIHEEATRLRKASSSSATTVKRPKSISASTKPKSRRKPTIKTPKDSFCIRCKTNLPANPEKPYCNSCYNTWNYFQNPEYEEKHCHICGKQNKSTLLKPLCGTCYKKYKGVFNFVTA